MTWRLGTIDQMSRSLFEWETNQDTGKSVFATIEWWQTFAEHLPHGRLEWWVSSGLAGGFPLLRYRRYGVETIMSGPLGTPGCWFSADETDTNSPLQNEGHLSNFLRAVSKRITGRCAFVPVGGGLAMPPSPWLDTSVRKQRWCLSINDYRTNSCSENHRRNIRRADTLNPELKRVETIDQIDSIWPLWAHTITRQKRTNPIQTKEFIADLFTALDGRDLLRVYFSTSNGLPAAAALVLIDRNTAIYWDGASSRENDATAASFWMFDRMIHQFRDEGFGVFDFGSGPDDAAGLKRFKSGWGAKSADYMGYDFRRRWYRALARRGKR